jgi:hypothetical protein
LPEPEAAGLLVPMSEAPIAPRPDPGTPPPSHRPDWRMAFLLAALAGVGLLVLGKVRGTLALPRIPVRVVADRDHLRLTSESPKDLPPITININSLDAHRFTLVGMRPNETVTLAWERFMDGDRPLDPRVTRPDLVLLRAKGYEVTILNVSRLTP